jgi:hypothetical protein
LAHEPDRRGCHRATTARQQERRVGRGGHDRRRYRCCQARCPWRAEIRRRP